MWIFPSRAEHIKVLDRSGRYSAAPIPTGRAPLDAPGEPRRGYVPAGKQALRRDTNPRRLAAVVISLSFSSLVFWLVFSGVGHRNR